MWVLRQHSLIDKIHKIQSHTPTLISMSSGSHVSSFRRNFKTVPDSFSSPLIKNQSWDLSMTGGVNPVVWRSCVANNKNIANSEILSKAQIPRPHPTPQPQIAIRGMLNHNYVDANYPYYCMRETGIKRKKNLSILAYSYTTYVHTVRVYRKFEDSGSNCRWEICDEFYEIERKMDNKKTDKHEDADSLLHNTTSHSQCLYQIQNPSLSSCWEICDEKFYLRKRKKDK